MRKADYAALAAIIKEQRDVLKAWGGARINAPDFAIGRHDAATTIARRFADSASVDRAAFLKACGIDP